MEDERGELHALNDTVEVGVVHVFEADHHVVFGRHVVRDVVIYNQSQQTIQEQQIDLLIYLIQLGLEEHQRLSLTHIPDTMEVVDPLTELID